MSKRAHARRQQPVVDDADVQQIADTLLGPSVGTSGPMPSDEDLVKIAEKIALYSGLAWGSTPVWRRELVRKVKRRVQFELMARRHASRPI